MKKNQLLTTKNAVLGLSLSLLGASLLFSTAHAQKVNVASGPIINGLFARIVCPNIASQSGGRWTGEYDRKKQTCEVDMPVQVKPAKPAPAKPVALKPSMKTLNMEVGTLWSQQHADQECPKVAAKNKGRWNGNWSSKTSTKPALCQIEVAIVAAPKPTHRIVDIAAGRIWSDSHANQRCTDLAKINKGTWTGKYSTQNSKSTCQMKVAIQKAPPAAVKPQPVATNNRKRKNVREVTAGRLNNQWRATQKCQKIAEQTNGTWTGDWTKSTPSKEGTCQIRFKKTAVKAPVTPAPATNGVVKEANAGPIWDQAHANRKCPIIAKNNKGQWTGNWRKVGANNMSVCQIRVSATSATETVYVPLPKPTPAAPVSNNVREVPAGPIWDQAQANTKCQLIAANNKGVWTGQWRKIGPNHNSLCSVRF